MGSIRATFSSKPLFVRGLLVCFWLPLALGAHARQTCSLLDNLDLSHLQAYHSTPFRPVSAGHSPAGVSLSSSTIKLQKKQGLGAYFSPTGFRTRPWGERASRKLLIFFLGGFDRGQASQGVSFENSELSSPVEPPDASKPLALALGWDQRKPVGGGNCWCPPKKREELENTLIRYCGGYEGNGFLRLPPCVTSSCVVAFYTAIGALS